MPERPPQTLVVFAHPYPDRSRSGRVLLSAVRDLPNVSVRSLYTLYPDFAIDVAAEQAALTAADTVVWQCPFYWYSVPALMVLWFEKVLALGWAYGEGGTALAGKRALWVTTTGAPPSAYRAGAIHGFSFDTFVPHIEQTARFCGMSWEPPLVVQGTVRMADEDLAGRAAEYRARITALGAMDTPSRTKEPK